MGIVSSRYQEEEKEEGVEKEEMVPLEASSGFDVRLDVIVSYRIVREELVSVPRNGRSFCQDR